VQGGNDFRRGEGFAAVGFGGYWGIDDGLKGLVDHREIVDFFEVADPVLCTVIFECAKPPGTHGMISFEIRCNLTKNSMSGWTEIASALKV
jgi:hypothetical protein